MLRKLLFLLCLMSPAAFAGENPADIFEPEARILFQGDSITDGGRGRGEDPNHILGHSYVFIIGAEYGAAFPEKKLEFFNRGISGNKITDIYARRQKDIFDLKPDVFSLLVGVNDAGSIAENRKNPVNAEEFEKCFDQLLRETKEKFPAVKIILGEPFFLKTGKYTGDAREKFNAEVELRRQAVHRLAEKYNAPVVPYQKIFDDACAGVSPKYWIWDDIHPTYAGQKLMADGWLKTYENFYGKAAKTPVNTALIPVSKLENDSYDWFARHEAVLTRQKEISPEIVLIGDSITHFWGGEPATGQNGKPKANGAEAWKKTFGDRRVLNMGFGWDRTQNVLWRLANGEMDGLAPKKIILNIGTNNFSGTKNARANTPEEVCAGIEEIVRQLRVKAPAAEIVVIGVFPRANPEYMKCIEKLNTLLADKFKTAGTGNVRFLDIGNKMKDADGKILPGIFFDGTHPTEKGYAIWGEALKDAGVP